MKRKLMVLVCAVVFGMGGTVRSFASSSPDPTLIAIDTIVVRPITFAATVLGSAVFVLSLPFAAASHSVHQTAEALVVKPAESTFTRPLGEFENMELDY